RCSCASGNCACKNDALPKQGAAIEQAIAGDRFQWRRRASILAMLTNAHDSSSLSRWSTSFAPIYSDAYSNGTQQSYFDAKRLSIGMTQRTPDRAGAMELCEEAMEYEVRFREMVCIPADACAPVFPGC